MIIPSIDITQGQTVQLVGGEDLAIQAGDPDPITRKFGLVGEIAIIDLDAAKGEGSNSSQIRNLLDLAPCRVGGGIRDYETARNWLDAGASRILLGTAATPSLLSRLPKERLIAAVDGRDDEVVVDGWRTRTGRAVVDTIRDLRDYVGGFLVTFVEQEGRRSGIDFDRVSALREACGDSQLCVAGGVRAAEEVARLDRMGVDAQVGMALYRGDFDLADVLYTTSTIEREDGLVPTIVCDEHGVALGLAWSSLDSLRQALTTRRGVYRSRKRGTWVKGSTSGATQDLVGVTLDCDRDTLRFFVRQHGSGFCHEGTRTCFADDPGPGALDRRIRSRVDQPVEESYVRRLMTEPGLLEAKLLEEAGELARATTRAEVVHEAADLQFFLQAKLVESEVSVSEVATELARRARRIERRGGDRKDGTTA